MARDFDGIVVFGKADVIEESQGMHRPALKYAGTEILKGICLRIFKHAYGEDL